jgi:hypothetical protein
MPTIESQARALLPIGVHRSALVPRPCDRAMLRECFRHLGAALALSRALVSEVRTFVAASATASFGVLW